MGRKAKLKQARKSPLDQPNSVPSDRDQFVQHMERQGYSLKRTELAPEVPRKRIEPQV